MKKTTLLCFYFILSIGFMFAQDGTYDTSFGSNGVVYTDINQQIEFFNALAQSPSGKIAVAGEGLGENDIVSFIVMYFEDGTIDASFADDGFLIDPISLEYNNIAFQSDEKIIFVYGNSSQTIGRLLPNGLTDTSFGNNGSINVDGRFLRLDENNQIYTKKTQNNTLTVKRFLPNGNLDTSYGTNGSLAITANNGGNVGSLNGTLLPNGKLFLTYDETVGGNAPSYIEKYTSNGNLDETFGTNGKTEIPIEEEFSCSARAFSDESVLLNCGYWDFDLMMMVYKLLKLSPTGNFDQSFGVNGYLDGRSVELIQQNQRFITNSSSVDYDGGTFINFKRYFNNGNLDNSFQFEPAPEVIQQTYKSIITNSGKLLVAANNLGLDASQDILLFQYNNDPLGIRDEKVISVTVFPNPSGSVFNVKGQQIDNNTYTVSDINGRVLLSGNFSGIENQLDLSHFSTGVYFLKISGTTIKLLKQ
ncbi:MAG TPA: hypothetical protein DEG69_02765 [Flavobacteriaceae bacterium]|jgi:uncharacterized delta-60 repeat protein|nr:hypothetical protein [Flavobacteriaceae bacterium]|tara:strand:- start:106173 stop:107594 length:1422 start_codon:yes stop_codon:yes gene_type:complete